MTQLGDERITKLTLKINNEYLPSEFKSFLNEYENIYDNNICKHVDKDLINI